MLRKLKTSDIFKVSKIIKKMGIKKELNFSNTKIDENGKAKIDKDGKEIKEDKNQTEVGAELIITVFENLHLAEDEVNEFLSDVAGMSKQEFEELEIEKVLEIIKEFKNTSGISNFLKSASQ